jgi:hypothetical protein
MHRNVSVEGEVELPYRTHTFAARGDDISSHQLKES